MSAHKGNPAPGVGGTAQDGGLSTADTVADGGPSEQAPDASYKPEGVAGVGDAPEPKQRDTRSGKAADGEAHVGNPAPGVGGTAGDGGLSTADTVADGGPDGEEEDGTYKP
ncbi:hypothetical protein K431DRAFT_316557 [Polychaeton citri CBS 116435]|uniref:Uncharacterized protein n=1 Tax=Polychaeton citri CBS 116435 TaxID=1314669 RepID=A0A9P4PWX6_9PEZI|nr:hypothetical protein K431DRAFT_316557 [Polychaeton citri CBS 116435]